jgi:Restriction endonuclease
MGKLKILASGNSPQTQAQMRGKLFEKLMAEVLRHYGYSIDHHITNVNYAGMEIDIEGRHLVTGIPLYAECKGYETEMVDAPKLQAFYGKYMAKWLKEKRLLNILLADNQGYPWLLKKLCAHVKAQREASVPQSEIANSLLNPEELFQEDLRGLLPEEEDTLRRIAKAAPISVSDLGEEFKHEIVRSLVNARLIVIIGNKYDMYWDIFRDYLNSGLVPIPGKLYLAPKGRKCPQSDKVAGRGKWNVEYS